MGVPGEGPVGAGVAEARCIRVDEHADGQLWLRHRWRRSKRQRTFIVNGSRQLDGAGRLVGSWQRGNGLW